MARPRTTDARAYWSPPERANAATTAGATGVAPATSHSAPAGVAAGAPPRPDEHEHGCDQAQPEQVDRDCGERPDRTGDPLDRERAGEVLQRWVEVLGAQEGRYLEGDAGGDGQRRQPAPETTFPAAGRGELQHQGEEHEPPDEAGVAQHGDHLGARQPVGPRGTVGGPGDVLVRQRTPGERRAEPEECPAGSLRERAPGDQHAHEPAGDHREHDRHVGRHRPRPVPPPRSTTRVATSRTGASGQVSARISACLAGAIRTW